VVPLITAWRLDIQICHNPETIAEPIAINMIPPATLMARMFLFNQLTLLVTQPNPKAIKIKGTPKPTQ
jgi:hypothetical protein